LYGYYHSLDGATLFSKVALNKLCHNVHSKVTLISAKFGADLITISKDRLQTIKQSGPVGPVFFGLYNPVQTNN